MVGSGAMKSFAGEDPGYFRKVVEILAGLDERRTGTKGAEKAARFIKEEFKKTGFPIQGFHSFSMPAITGHKATITSLATGKTHGITPFLGNVISPPFIPLPGMEAHLVYVGKGEIAEFNKKKIANGCVLMDLDSGKNWINALSLGARAVIYLSNGTPDRYSYEDKMELSPVSFPRFVMERSRAEELFGDPGSFGNAKEELLVRLASDFSWNPVQAENLYCLVPGTDPELEMIVIEGFYDAPAFVPGVSPGADESCSIATLLCLARYLKDHPPRRSILLMATSGHGESLAGMREIIWSLTEKKKSLRAMGKKLDLVIDGSKLALLDLVNFKTHGDPDGKIISRILGHIGEDIRTRVDLVNGELMELRLKDSDKAGLIPTLARQRNFLKQLSWKSGKSQFSLQERKLVGELVPGAIGRLGLSIKDAENQRKNLDSSLALRAIFDKRKVGLFISLHLSSHGNGIGLFNQGGFYPMKETISSYPSYALVDKVFAHAGKTLDNKLKMLDFFKDTLRPNFDRSWESYLFDKPALGGEVSQLAGFMGISLATVSDARILWGTPRDMVSLVDFNNGEIQSRYINEMILLVAAAPGFATGRELKNGFATIHGRANTLRFGEIFADAPAARSMVLSFQGEGIHHSMVDETGNFYIKGVADKKHVLHKVIIEGYRFDPETGKIVLAVDKKQTSKDGYRVKVNRLANTTDLVMFPCEGTTLVDLLEPRNFDYMTNIELLDGRIDAPLLRYWFSRIDTRASTLCSVFLAPGSFLKLTLSDTMVTRKLILTNADPDHPGGKGYFINDYPFITPTQFLGARDMWALLNPRIDNLEDKGINNQKIRDLRTSGNLALEEAESFLSAGLYDSFFAAAATSLALAGRVYQHVESVQKDVLFGVLFYIALFVPFAFCLERFSFGFSNIYKRIIAFLLILIGLIIIIYNVHPAFELAYSPVVVILAFFILALSALVAWIIFLRFEEGIKGSRQSAGDVTEISLVAAFSASFFMGVTNLRRRRLRTILTCTTLIILTFTVMSFTSVKNIRQHSRMLFNNQAPYQGMLIKKLDWNSLPESAVKILGHAFDKPGASAPRAWLENDDRTRGMAVPVLFKDAGAEAHGVMGLSPLEPGISGFGLNGLHGQWFSENEPYTVMISEAMAKKLHLKHEEVGRAVVKLWSVPFRVIAVFNEKVFDEFKDLDGESLSPVIFPDELLQETSEAEMEAMESGQEVKTFQSRYRHLGFDRTIIIPQKTLVSMGGQSISVVIKKNGDMETVGKKFVDRFGLWLFSGEKAGVFLYSASDTLSYSGIPNILVPILISVFIVLNTMIGSVYERKGEIGIYTSVGMAPLHVSILFIAEALSYAVLSVVLGYLLAQTVAFLFAGTSLLSGITVNYSSLAGVGAMAMVMGVVLVSAIYPSRVAAKIAIPDVEKSWKLSISKGDKMVVDLPFLMRGGDEISAAGCLYDYFYSHREISQDVFTSDELRVVLPINEEDGLSGFSLEFRAWVAPFDLGLMQDVVLTFKESATQRGYIAIAMEITRKAGEHNAWFRANRRFVNSIRKKLLVWRSLDEDKKNEWNALFCILDKRRKEIA